MEDITPLIQLLGTKAPQIALYWLAAEKVMKLLQPLIVSRLNAAIERVVETADGEDEKMLRGLFGSRCYRFVAFALDVLIRLKLPGIGDLDKALADKTKKARLD